MGHMLADEVEELRQLLEQRTQERDAESHLAEQRRVEGRRILDERNAFEAVVALLEERVRELEATQLETLSFFYRRYPVVVATYCDETLDPSGVLLGRVRKRSK